MARTIELKTAIDERGHLGVIEGEDDIPFSIKRVFFIYDVPQNVERGKHRHRKNRQALVCVKGSCRIDVDSREVRETHVLDNPRKCLILDPVDWHRMSSFSADAVLVVLASEHYDRTDYIYEVPRQ